MWGCEKREAEGRWQEAGVQGMCFGGAFGVGRGCCGDGEKVGRKGQSVESNARLEWGAACMEKDHWGRKRPWGRVAWVVVPTLIGSTGSRKECKETKICTGACGVWV